MKRNLSIVVMLLFCLVSCRSSSRFSDEEGDILSALLPDTRAVRLTPAARLKEDLVPECSGIVMSRVDKKTCWAVGDSGNGPWLYRLGVSLAGSDELSINLKEKIRITGWGNRDWEDIAVDETGSLFIADMGNNFSLRNDLAILRMEEPKKGTLEAGVTGYPFFYHEQAERKVSGNAFDAEALFCFNRRVYLFTKRRRDKLTALYRFDSLKKTQKNMPVLMGHLKVDGLVTGADSLASEKLVALLTYKSIWLLRASQGDRFLAGKISWLPIRAGQCEGIAFLDKEKLLISNESGEFFLLRLDSFKDVKRIVIR